MAEKLKLDIDMDDFTFGELELFEDVTGLVMSDAVKQETVRDKNNRPVPDPDDPKGRPLKEVKMSARAMMGMIFLVLRKQNPETSFEDVRAMKLSDIDFSMTEKEDEDPLEIDSESEKNEPSD